MHKLPIMKCSALAYLNIFTIHAWYHYYLTYFYIYPAHTRTYISTLQHNSISYSYAYLNLLQHNSKPIFKFSLICSIHISLLRHKTSSPIRKIQHLATLLISDN